MTKDEQNLVNNINADLFFFKTCLLSDMDSIIEHTERLYNSVMLYKELLENNNKVK